MAPEDLLHLKRPLIVMVPHPVLIIIRGRLLYKLRSKSSLLEESMGGDSERERARERGDVLVFTVGLILIQRDREK